MNHAPAVPVWTLLLVVLALFGVTACRDDRISPSTAPPTPARLVSPEPPGSAPPSTGPAPTTPASRGIHLRRTADPYLGLGELLHERGVRIWWESDLVARWLEGPAAFAEAIGRLAVLARQPGTAGIKVADEIGYHDGLASPAQALSFLRDVNKALAKAAPRAAILVDAVVLELGCLPRSDGVDDCEHKARSTAPAATITALTAYLRAGLIDRLDLSTGLGEPDAYPDDDLAAAQSVAWTYVASGPWPGLTTLQSRKALAEAGGYSGDAASDVNVFVATPRRHGAAATDIWTWRQTYQSQTVSLFGANPRRSSLWPILVAQHRRGVRLFTHMTPSSMPTSDRELGRECDAAAQVFSDVFVAAGTG